jgi:hypothetical protein
MGSSIRGHAFSFEVFLSFCMLFQKVEELRARLRGWRESEEVPTTVSAWITARLRGLPFNCARMLSDNLQRA